MKRLLLILLALLLPPLPAARAAPAELQLAPDSEARWVAFDLTAHNQIRFPLVLNGHPATALLDTGVSDTVVSRKFAEVIGLKPRTHGQAQAIGGTVALDWAAGVDLAIGGLSRTGGRIAITDSGALAAPGLGGIDVVIGGDILSCCALDIDFDARRFRFLPSGRMPFGGSSAPLHLAPQSNSFLTELTLAGRRVRPILVDTGDGSSVTLARAAWDASGYHPAALTSTIAFGLGGPIETDLAIVPELRLASLRLGETEVRVEPAGGFSARVGMAGRIGTGLLLGYHVLLDPRAGHMILAPGLEAGRPVLRSTSGLLLAFSREHMRVLHVMRGSPAAEGAWKANDLICAVDGVPVAQTVTSSGLVSWSAGTAGRTLTIELCDGTRRTLTLRRFY